MARQHLLGADAEDADPRSVEVGKEVTRGSFKGDHLGLGCRGVWGGHDVTYTRFFIRQGVGGQKRPYIRVSRARLCS
jgi:hypothetical protein